jgi:hypothetical protein
VVEATGLSPTEARRLDRLDRVAAHDPDVYRSEVELILSERETQAALRGDYDGQLAQLRASVEALRADRDAAERGASGVDRVGGAGSGGSGSYAGGDTFGPLESLADAENAYLAIHQTSQRGAAAR